MAHITGVDGCPAGWLCISRNRADNGIRSCVLASARELFDYSREFAVVAIDIPIGLPTEGNRDCDRKAAERLGPRRHSVFPVPFRAVVETTTYAEACAMSSRLCDKKISKQTFALFPKIREVDAELHVHPELRS